MYISIDFHLELTKSGTILQSDKILKPELVPPLPQAATQIRTNARMIPSPKRLTIS